MKLFGFLFEKNENEEKKIENRNFRFHFSVFKKNDNLNAFTNSIFVDR